MKVNEKSFYRYEDIVDYAITVEPKNITEIEP